MIKNSGDCDRWLIFVREKTTGEQLLQELSDIDGGIVFMTNETDRDSEDYLSLIQKHELPKRVLIATKFIDVGINIVTKHLHVVIFEDNIVEMKQMIGRKRVTKKEKVEVYFFAPSYKELRRRLGRVEEQIKEEKIVTATVNSSYENISYYADLPYPLYAKGNEVRYNALSLKKHEADRYYYQELLEMLADYKDSPSDYLLAYEKYILTHFPGACEAVQIENDVDDESYRMVAELAWQWMGRTISKEELEIFSDQLTAIVGDSRKDKRDGRGKMAKNSLNKALTKYGYVLISNNETPVTYRLEKMKGKEGE